MFHVQQKLLADTEVVDGDRRLKLHKYAAKVEHGYRHSKGFTFQDFHEPIRITEADLSIVQDNCVRCHEALVDQMNYITNFAVGGVVESVMAPFRCDAPIAMEANPGRS